MEWVRVIGKLNQGTLGKTPLLRAVHGWEHFPQVRNFQFWWHSTGTGRSFVMGPIKMIKINTHKAITIYHLFIIFIPCDVKYAGCMHIFVYGCEQSVNTERLVPQPFCFPSYLRFVLCVHVYMHMNVQVSPNPLEL